MAECKNCDYETTGHCVWFNETTDGHNADDCPKFRYVKKPAAGEET